MGPRSRSAWLTVAGVRALGFSLRRRVLQPIRIVTEIAGVADETRNDAAGEDGRSGSREASLLPGDGVSVGCRRIQRRLLGSAHALPGWVDVPEVGLQHPRRPVAPSVDEIGDWYRAGDSDSPGKMIRPHMGAFIPGLAANDGEPIGVQ